MKSEPLILAIESSCDDTSVAVLRGRKVLSNIISSQKVHEKYGGVVPELASRAHQKNILPTLDVALSEANVKLKDLDAIAVTRGPGLLGSLLVGVSLAKSIALALSIPLTEVNHMEAHVLAHFIDDQPQKAPEFPFICMTVSGGHTQLLKVSSPFDFQILGETIDDAAGEAFDKISKMLALPYPGGPVLDRLANTGDPSRFQFSLPKVDAYNFSFSGLKTSVLYFLQKEMKVNPNFIQEHLNDLCASVQQAILQILMKQLERVVADTGISRVAIAGGVSANTGLRHELASKKELGWEVYVPDFQYCTDNAGMIGIAAYFKFLDRKFADLSLAPSARLKIN